MYIAVVCILHHLMLQFTTSDPPACFFFFFFAASLFAALSGSGSQTPSTPGKNSTNPPFHLAPCTSGSSAGFPFSKARGRPHRQYTHASVNRLALNPFPSHPVSNCRFVAVEARVSHPPRRYAIRPGKSAIWTSGSSRFILINSSGLRRARRDCSAAEMPAASPLPLGCVASMAAWLEGCISEGM